jgi:glycosyltransferase involved in cell wall biosynthesis
MKDIIVSVFMLTYNQEKFISQAIEGVLMQKTKFNYQLVIGEDCSDDQTRVICEKYALQYPKIIILLPSQFKNIGLIANYMRTIRECGGKYIAICDGDDFWTDEYKLQKQVDFLEFNTDYSIVYTNLKKLFPNGKEINAATSKHKQDTVFEDLIFENFIPSVTVLFKNIQNVEIIPQWITYFPYGDWPTYLWTIKDGGKIHFLNECMAVYRMDIGVSSQIRKVNRDIIKINLNILKCIYEDINFINKRQIVSKSIEKKNIELMITFNNEKKYLKAFIKYICLIVKQKNKYQLTKMYLYSLKKIMAALFT